MSGTEYSPPDVEAADISRRWLIAAAGFIPVVLQSVTYLCYKSFLGFFNVRPEEVGYDFASLLGQQAAALVVVSAAVLTVAALCAFFVTYIGYVLAPLLFRKVSVPEFVKSKIPFLSRAEGRYADVWVLVFAAVTLFSWLLSDRLFGGGLALLHIPFVGLLLALDHAVYRRGAGSRDRSVWMRLTEPESYGATRILVLALVVALVLAESPGSGIDRVNLVVTVLALVFILDRAILKPRDTELRRRVDGRIRLPIAITFAATAGVGIIVCVGGIDSLMKYGGIQRAIRETESGVGYINPPFDWKSMVVPDARPVTITWSNSMNRATSVDLAGRSSIDAILLGQANSTTVVWWAEKKKTLRLPSSVVIVSSRGTASPLSGL